MNQAVAAAKDLLVLIVNTMAVVKMLLVLVVDTVAVPAEEALLPINKRTEVAIWAVSVAIQVLLNTHTQTHTNTAPKRHFGQDGMRSMTKMMMMHI